MNRLSQREGKHLIKYELKTNVLRWLTLWSIPYLPGETFQPWLHWTSIPQSHWSDFYLFTMTPFTAWKIMSYYCTAVLKLTLVYELVLQNSTTLTPCMIKWIQCAYSTIARFIASAIAPHTCFLDKAIWWVITNNKKTTSLWLFLTYCGQADDIDHLIPSNQWTPPARGDKLLKIQSECNTNFLDGDGYGALRFLPACVRVIDSFQRFLLKRKNKKE